MAHKITSLIELRQAAANEIAAIQASKDASDSSVSRFIDAAGIDADVTPKDASGQVKVTAKVDETEGLPSGTTRSDFTSAALAVMDAKTLKRERERIWQFFRRMNRGGHFSASQTVNALRNLGYTALPSPTTNVTAYVSVGQPVFDRYGDQHTPREALNFTLPGEVTEESVRAKLEAVAPVPAATSLVKSAFGSDAEGLPSVISDLYVATQQSWPDHSEYCGE
jgi:hypothetical protein